MQLAYDFILIVDLIFYLLVLTPSLQGCGKKDVFSTLKANFKMQAYLMDFLPGNRKMITKS